MTTKAVLRRLETLGKPVVAAINGAALGGGLEIALACHHRIVVDDPKIELGFPEVTLGLLPGAGGVMRTVRMLGIADALLQVLLQGQRVPAGRGARSSGSSTRSCRRRDELLGAAKAWIAANPEAVQPWDVKGYKIPGGTPSTPTFAANLPAFPANLRKQLKGANYPGAAPHPGRRGRGRAGRLRHRVGDRGPLLRRPGHRPGRQEHDPGVLLRPAGGQPASAAVPTTSRRSSRPRWSCSAPGMMGAGIAYVCARRPASRSCSRTSRRRPPSAARPTRRSSSTRRSSAAAPPRRTATRCWPGSRRRPTRPPRRAPTS